MIKTKYRLWSLNILDLRVNKPTGQERWTQEGNGSKLWCVTFRHGCFNFFLLLTSRWNENHNGYIIIINSLLFKITIKVFIPIN